MVSVQSLGSTNIENSYTDILATKGTMSCLIANIKPFIFFWSAMTSEAKDATMRVSGDYYMRGTVKGKQSIPRVCVWGGGGTNGTQGELVSTLEEFQLS